MSLLAPPRAVRVASWVLTVVALALALSAAFIMFAPVDATNFAAEAGVEWSEFSAANPEASSYLTREARLLASGYLTLGLIAATLAWRPLRIGNRWAKVALWIFATGLLCASAIFFVSGDTTLGATYLTAAIVCAGSLTLLARVAPNSVRRDG